MRETLEARIRTRKTRRKIDRIEAQMSKRGITGWDSNGTIGGPEGGDTAGARGSPTTSPAGVADGTLATCEDRRHRCTEQDLIPHTRKAPEA